MNKKQRSVNQGISKHIGKQRGRTPEDEILRQLFKDWATDVVSRCGCNHTQADDVIFTQTVSGRLIDPRPKRFMERLCKGMRAGKYFHVDLAQLVDELEEVPGFKYTRRRFHRPIYRFLLAPPILVEELGVILVNCFKRFGVVRVSQRKHSDGIYARRQMYGRDIYAPPVEYCVWLSHKMELEGIFRDERRSIGSRLLFLSALYYEAIFARNIIAMAELRIAAEKVFREKGRLNKEFGATGAKLLKSEFKRRVLDVIFTRNNLINPFPHIENGNIGGPLLLQTEAAGLEADRVKYKKQSDAFVKALSKLEAEMKSKH